MMSKWLVKLTDNYGKASVEAESWTQDEDGGLTFWRGGKEFAVVAPGRWIFVVEDLSE